MNEVFTSLKRKETSFHSATGKSTLTVFDVYTLTQVNGKYHLGRHTFNGYVNYGFCQWGVTDSKRIAEQFGFEIGDKDCPCGVCEFVRREAR